MGIEIQFFVMQPLCCSACIRACTAALLSKPGLFLDLDMKMMMIK